MASASMTEATALEFLPFYGEDIENRHDGIIRNGTEIQSLPLDSLTKDLELLWAREAGKAESPAVNRLPPELLSKIFLRYVSEGPTLVCKDAPQMRLTHVCQYWRAVSCCSSELWASIHLPPPVRQPRIPHYTLLVKLWVERSAPRPISLDVDMRPSQRPYHELYFVIFSASARWRSAKLIFTHRTLLLLQQHTFSFSQLKSLDISTGDWRIQNAEWTAFHSTPALTDLTARGWTDCGVFPSIPWLQLDRLAMHIAGPNVLSQVSQLRHLTLLGVCWQDWSHICRHDAIESLTFEDCFSSERWLNKFSLPRLNAIHLRDAWDHSSALPDRLRSFTSRSGCTIRSLTLSRCHLSGENLLEVLRSLPTVHHLLLDEPDTDMDRVSLGLTAHLGDAQPSVLPYLDTLILHLVHSFDAKLLIEMIQSRWSTDRGWVNRRPNDRTFVAGSHIRPARLRRVDLTGFPVAGFEETCLRWKAEGMRIEIQV